MDREESMAEHRASYCNEVAEKAKYDKKTFGELEDADLEMVAAGARGDWMSDYIGEHRFKK